MGVERELDVGGRSALGPWFLKPRSGKGVSASQLFRTVARAARETCEPEHRSGAMTYACAAGVDVGRDWLDVGLAPSGKVFRWVNGPSGIEALVARLRREGVVRVVLESIGTYGAGPGPGWVRGRGCRSQADRGPARGRGTTGQDRQAGRGADRAVCSADAGCRSPRSKRPGLRDPGLVDPPPPAAAGARSLGWPRSAPRSKRDCGP